MVRRELSQKAKLSIYQSIYIPILTNGHEFRIVTKRIRSWKQVPKMIFFFCRVARLTLTDRIRSLDNQRDLRVEPLLLQVKRRQLRLFGHLIRMAPGSLSLEVV